MTVDSTMDVAIDKGASSAVGTTPKKKMEPGTSIKMSGKSKLLDPTLVQSIPYSTPRLAALMPLASVLMERPCTSRTVALGSL